MQRWDVGTVQERPDGTTEPGEQGKRQEAKVQELALHMGTMNPLTR